MKGSTFKERFDRWKNGESYWDIIDKPLAKYGNGKDYDGYNIQHVKQGSLGKDIDALIDLPDVKIIGDALKNKNRIYNSSFDLSGLTNFINTATLGGLNNLSPTQWARRGYDAAKGKLTADSWFNGNNGIVTNKFANEHPILAGVTNMAGDALVFGLGNAAKKLELYKNLNPLNNAYTRNIIYYNKEPFGYTDQVNTVKAIAKDYITGKNRDYTDAPWEEIYINGENRSRLDAWRLYNKLPLRYNTFVPSEKYPGSFTAKKDIDELQFVYSIDPADNVINAFKTNTPIKYGDVDFVNGSGGNVNSTATGLFSGNVGDKLIHGGIIQTLDLWDLHPLQGFNSVKNLARYSPFLSKFFNTRLGTKISDRIGRLEAGKIFGAKPFNVINDVPVTLYGDDVVKGFPEDILNTNFGRKILAQYPQTDFRINSTIGDTPINNFNINDPDRFTVKENNTDYNNIVKIFSTNATPSYKTGKDSVQGFVSTFRPLLYNTLLKKGYHTNSMDNMLTLLAWESNYGKSNNAKVNNNYGGIKNGSGYANYLNPLDFIDHYVDLIHDRYPNAFNSTDLNSYAKSLKDNGYYEDSLSHYSSNLNNMKSLRKAIDNERINNLSKYNNTLSYDLIMSEQQDAIQTHKPNIVLIIPLFKQKKQPKQIIYPNYILQPNLLPNIMDIYLNAVNGRNPLTIPWQ